jgi:membrane-associated phospholipid phosphatase
LGKLAALDLRLLRLLRTRGHTPEAERAMVNLARAGENGLLWQAVAASGALVSARRRRDHVRAMQIVLGTLVLNTAIKYLVRRARPVLEELPALTPVLSGRSYPLAAAGLPSAPLHAVAVAMAVSRPYLGVHYPSDVVAGAFLGDAVARVMTP